MTDLEMELDLEDSPGNISESSAMSPNLSSFRKRRDNLELPLPPGALPPRKRAKTAIEKEQRRVERILRNRQAAQSSREKKRRQLEELEIINDGLRSENKLNRDRLSQMEIENSLLRSKLEQLSSQMLSMKSSLDGFKFEPFVATTASTTTSKSLVPEITVDEHEQAHNTVKSESADFLSFSDMSSMASIISPSIASSLLSSEACSPVDMISLESLDSSLDSASVTPSDARSIAAFKMMHHPAAMMSLDLQRLLKERPQSMVLWIELTRAVIRTISTLLTISLLCFLTLEQKSRRARQLSLSKSSTGTHCLTSRPRLLRKAARLLTMLAHYQPILSSTTNLRCLTFQNCPQMLSFRKMLFKTFSFSQSEVSSLLSRRSVPVRSSGSRHMALAPAVATGLRSQRSGSRQLSENELRHFHDIAERQSDSKTRVNDDKSELQLMVKVMLQALKTVHRQRERMATVLGEYSS
ncbi:uncharacterized protein V1516DRAFT_680229 [Lipomyces oligophaga]|uniref:uncharacterized protein n=1 Tax=Lipomyces oligophaga TaxID=45792 RepID=UPI0034CF2834